MVERFDAFISYKHAPLDNKVADEIQKGLERYPVPAKLKKKLGKQKIERIFRDKTELPITSSLSDNISYALEHSDFLIVICSHNTKLSGWVPREIEYFLKFHPMNHVLTVLAEGEPGEVIPEQLLKTQVPVLDSEGNAVLDENGEPVMEELPLEPLSCDWRLPQKQAKREELPRLAAAILGCSYDELIQRARAYRRRRMTIILSITGIFAAAAISYLLWSRAQIQKNYEESQANLRQAQINQSEYLANASAMKLEQDHDGVGAVQLALAALPSEGEERPVVPEAMSAAVNAMQCYVPEDYFYAGKYPNKKYSMGSFVSNIAVDKDRKTLFVLDESGEVGVFDIFSQEKLFTVNFEDVYKDRMSILPLEEGRLLVCDGNNMHCVDWKNDKKLWTVPLFADESGNTFRETFVYSIQLYLYELYGFTGRDYSPNVAYSLSPDGSLLAADGSNDVINILDINDGSVVETLCAGISQNASGDIHQNNIQKLAWSEDSRYIAAVYVTEDSPGGVSLLIYDRQEKAWQKYDTGEENWEDMCFAGNDRVILLTAKGYLEGSSVMHDFQGDGSSLKASDANAWCYSLSEGALLWSTPLPWEYPYETPGDCAYYNNESAGIETAAFTIANKAFALNVSDGSILLSQAFTDTALGIYGFADDDVMITLKNGDMGHLRGYTEGVNDGQFQFPFIYKTDTEYSMKKLIAVPDEKNVTALIFQEYSRDVLGFGNTWDPEGTVLEGEGLETSPTSSWISGKYLLVINDEGFFATDITSGKRCFEYAADWESPLSSFAGEDLGMSADTRGLLVQSGDDFTLLLFDLSAGTTEKIPLDENWSVLRSGLFYRITSDDEEGCRICRYSLADNSEEVIAVNDPEGDHVLANGAFIVSPDGRRIAADTENKSICVIDLEKGETTVIKESVTDSNYFIWSEDNTHYALISNTTIRLFSVDGELLFEIPTNGRDYLDAHFDDDHLYVLYDSAKLFRYRLSDGEEDGVTSVGLYVNSMNNITWTFEDDRLYLLAGSNNLGRMNTIDLNEMETVSVIDNCCGYSPQTDRYIVLNHAADDLYYYVSFPQYTAEDLVRKGLEFIGGSEMSPEMKAAYGL